MASNGRIGVVGLGHMGSRIAKKLLEAGSDVAVWDRDEEAMDELERDGAGAAGSPRELAEACDVVLTCLENDEAVLRVALDEEGTLAGLGPGAVYVECSTVAPGTIRALADAARPSGVKVVDASMSGSTPQVEDGAVIVLAGGDAHAVARARPALEPWSKAVLHMGDTGAGAATKLAVNVILGVGMEAIAEAIVLGEAQGIDRTALIDALGQTAVVADAHRAKLENAKNDDYPVAFAARLMRKDFGLILDEAKALGIRLPATQAAATVAADAPLDEDEDFSVVVRSLELDAGVSEARARPASRSGRSTGRARPD